MTAAGKPLDGLLQRIRSCRACIDTPRGPPLPHEPRPVLRAHVEARIAICGQAPGRRVHLSGVPFSDPSGDRLRSWMGIEPADFYDERRIAIVPMGFCFPGYTAKGADLPPRRECAPLWRAQVFGLLPRIELMLLVGIYAIKWHLPECAGRSLSAIMEDALPILRQPGRHPAVIPLPHPSWRNTSWLKAHPAFESDLLPELRARVGALMTR